MAHINSDFVRLTLPSRVRYEQGAGHQKKTRSNRVSHTQCWRSAAMSAQPGAPAVDKTKAFEMARCCRAVKLAYSPHRLPTACCTSHVSRTTRLRRRSRRWSTGWSCSESACRRRAAAAAPLRGCSAALTGRLPLAGSPLAASRSVWTRSEHPAPPWRGCRPRATRTRSPCAAAPPRFKDSDLNVGENSCIDRCAAKYWQARVTASRLFAPTVSC